MLNEIAQNCADKFTNNELKLWQIKTNEIGNSLRANGLLESWEYHPLNKMEQLEDEAYYDFQSRKQNVLKQIVYDLFTEKLPPEKREQAILNKGATY